MTNKSPIKSLSPIFKVLRVVRYYWEKTRLSINPVQILQRDIAVLKHDDGKNDFKRIGSTHQSISGLGL